MKDRIQAIRNHAKKLKEYNSIPDSNNLEEQVKTNRKYRELFQEFPSILEDIADELELIRPAINREV